MRPWEIARLTDWQIDNLYRKPQSRRIEDVNNRTPSSGGGASSDGERYVPPVLAAAGGTTEDVAAGLKAMLARGETPPRGQMVTLYMTFGMSYPAANAAYDRHLAEWKKTHP